MARPPSDNPSDITLRIRTHKSVRDRLWRVARANKRTAGKEALIAIEKYLLAEEKRLGLSPPAHHSQGVTILSTTAEVLEHFTPKALRAAEEAPQKKRRLR